MEAIAHPDFQAAGGVASFGFVFVDGTVQTFYGAVCHASLKYAARPVALIFSKLLNRSDETGKTYHRFLLDETYPEVFQQGLVDTDWCMDNQAVIIGNLDKIPGNILLTALTFTRHAHEFPERMKVWQLLVDNGVSPRLATWGMSLCRFVESDLQQYTGAMYPGHWCLQTPADDGTYLRRWLQDDRQYVSEPYEPKHGYVGVHRLYDDKDCPTGTYGWGRYRDDIVNTVNFTKLVETKSVTQPGAYKPTATSIINPEGFVEFIKQQGEKALSNVAG